MPDDRHARVSRRAYQLWEQEGGEHGRHEDHWRQADAEIGSDAGIDESVVAAPDGTTLTTPSDTIRKGATTRTDERAAPKAKAAAKLAAPTANKAPAKPPKNKTK